MAFLTAHFDAGSNEEWNMLSNISEARDATHILLKIAAEEVWDQCEASFVKTQ